MCGATRAASCQNIPFSKLLFSCCFVFQVWFNHDDRQYSWKENGKESQIVCGFDRLVVDAGQAQPKLSASLHPWHGLAFCTFLIQRMTWVEFWEYSGDIVTFRDGFSLWFAGLEISKNNKQAPTETENLYFGVCFNFDYYFLFFFGLLTWKVSFFASQIPYSQSIVRGEVRTIEQASRRCAKPTI